MVKHPRNQAQDDGRQDEIPRAFVRYCDEEYKLERIEPVREKDPLPGPIPRPTFRILRRSGDLVAHFTPGGGSKCYDESFRKIFEKMKKAIEQAGLDAIAEYDQI